MIHYALGAKLRPFLAAAFATGPALDTWLGSVPEQRRAGITTLVDEEHDFPVFLLETEKLRWLNRGEVGEQFQRWIREERSADWCHGNLYFVREEWHPANAGTDRMGSLPHVHVDATHLRHFKLHGIDGLLV